MNIRILDNSFALKFVSKRDADDHRAYGWCQYDPPEINIQAGLDHVKTAGTVIHEVLHAIMESSRGCPLPKDEDKLEEYFVTVLSVGLVTTLKHNPAFLNLLYDLIKDGESTKKKLAK